MIEVRIYLDKTELGRVRITNQEMHEDGTADYSVEFAVERVGAVGLHRRAIRYFPRLRYNVLGLLLQALNTLNPKELELEQGTRSPDLARRQLGVGSALPPEAPDSVGDY